MGIRKDIDDLAGVGVQFDSYHHLRKTLNRMTKRGHHYRIASSEVLRNLDGSQEEKFRYRSVVFHCVHYGSPRIRGNGSRQVSHLATGCNSFIRINFSYRHRILEVTKSYLSHHGHQLQTEKVGRPHYKRAILPKKVKVQKQKKIQRKVKCLTPEKEVERQVKCLTPEKEVERQAEYVSRLMKKQQENFAQYAKARTRRGLPSFNFDPPSLEVSNLLYYYALESNPYVVPKVKEEHERDDEDDEDEEEEEDVRATVKTLREAIECSVTPPMLTAEENGDGFSQKNVCGENMAYGFDGSGNRHNYVLSPVKECTVEVEFVGSMDQSLYNQDFFSLTQIGAEVVVTESNA